MITNDKDLHEKVSNLADKSYDRLNTGRRLTMLAPCYRITELQSAVALGQMEKLQYITKTRHDLGDAFNKGIQGFEGISAHRVDAGNYCTYWFTMNRVDPSFCNRNEFAGALRSEGIPASGGYIKKPLYLEPVFVNKNFFPSNIWPAEMLAKKEISYKRGDCPVAEKVLDSAIRIEIKETFSMDKVNQWIEKFKMVHQFYLED